MTGGSGGSPGGAPWRELAAVFAAAAVVYLASPVRQAADSTYSLLVAHQLWNRGSFDLREHVGPDPDRVRFPGFRLRGFPYHLRPVGRGVRRPHLRPRDPWRVYYAFPIGTPLLAVPVVAVAQAAGAPVVDPAHGGYLVDRERRLQGWSAPFFAAGFVAAAYAALRRALVRRVALAATIVLALASPLWSTASRVLWSHTGCLLLAGFALPAIVRLARGERASGAAIGGWLAGAYVARPTAAILVAAVGVWLALRHRRAFVGFLLGALPVLAAFAWINLSTWGELLPPYYDASRVAGWPEAAKLAGQLVSPNRGLLVFLPWIVPLVALGAMRWRRMEHRDLFVLGAAGAAALVAVTATFGHWWGGYSYGPRLLTESIFFFVLCAVAVLPTLAGESSANRGWRRALVACAAAGVVIHAGGALSRQGMLWNALPRSVDEAPERIWDWSDPQWLAWANRAPRVPLAPLAPREGEPDERP